MTEEEIRIRNLVSRFQNRLGFMAPELHDDAWADFADDLIELINVKPTTEPSEA